MRAVRLSISQPIRTATTQAGSLIVLVIDMRGISEERLRELCKRHAFINFLLDECNELNPWIPIESAPWNKPILVYYPTMEEGLRIRVIGRRVNWDSSLHKPTHWQELPREPI